MKSRKCKKDPAVPADKRERDERGRGKQRGPKYELYFGVGVVAGRRIEETKGGSCEAARTRPGTHALGHQFVFVLRDSVTTVTTVQ